MTSYEVWTDGGITFKDVSFAKARYEYDYRALDLSQESVPAEENKHDFAILLERVSGKVRRILNARGDTLNLAETLHRLANTKG